ncbi:hypothetical protein AB1L42_08350 [Thalassoglobus sp. JC818]|uniref:hypothetical protein n=1 Tax=Thalassoglobus sp. JC818 TaxID=3232136 RepID=UPI0034592858
MIRLTLLATALTTCGLSVPLFAQDADDVFQRLDENKDGILTAEEVPEAQRRFFDRLVRSGDKNEDGKLSQAEYQATLTEDDAPQDRDPGRRPGEGRPGEGRFGQGRPGAGPGRGPGGMGGADFFARFDKNEDGKLTIDEAPEQMRERLQSIMDRLGTDEIDLEQMSQMRGRDRGDRPSRDDEESAMRRDGSEREERDDPRNRRDREDGDRREDGRPDFGRPPRGGGFAFMRILDADRNGSISKAEALEVGRLFRELDANDDGELDNRELMGSDGDRQMGMMMGRGDGRPPFGRPESGDRPEGASDRPERDRPDGDRREGDRPEGDRRDGDRPEGGPRGRFGDRGPGGEGPGRGFNPMQGFIDRFDTDKDGAISKSEAPERMAEGFDRLDANGDGKLTAEEFEALAGGRRGDGDRPGFGRGNPEERRDRPARPELEE